jgi:uncharacterized iron-regulated protein
METKTIPGNTTMARNILAAALLTAAVTGCAVQPPQTSANMLLMGEVHDNPKGHQQRFDDLRKRVESGWRPAIVMEQFDRENQAALTQAQANCPDAQCVIQAAGGKRWQWPFYEPVITLALQYRLPLVAGNVSRTDAAIAMKQGLPAVLDANTVAAFRLQEPLPADLFAGQRHAIETGHCGKLPDTMAPGMVRAQVARDVWMAKMLLNHADTTGAVLLAGNGHVRKDLGVPRWLPAAARADTLVHGYVEQGDTVAANVYDTTHTVAAHPRPDPCLAFAAPRAASALPSPPPNK